MRFSRILYRMIVHLRVFFVLALIMCVPLHAAFADGGENIASFDARITVNEDATVQVIEQIVYDFGTRERRGIFRTIPYSYQAGDETYTADVTNVVVVNADDVPYSFNESRTGGELTLKIGDPNVTVTGEHTYIISYTVAAPFLYYEDYEEFYWNVTGGSWQTGIEQASVLVDLPTGATVLMAACYQGAAGSNERCDKDERLVNVERAGYHAVASGLKQGEGFTIAVRFPAGTIKKIAKPWSPKPKTPLEKYWPFGVPVLLLGALVWRWYTRGRDPAGRTTIVPQYEAPEDMAPSIAGIVYNEAIEPREIFAEIIRLATQGHLRIHRFEKQKVIFSQTDYLLERLQPDKSVDDPVGALMLEKLFQSEYEGEEVINGTTVKGVLLSKMEHTFASDKEDIVDELYAEVYEQGYFVERPDKVRTRYVVAGGIVAFFSGALLIFKTGELYVVTGIAGIVSGALVALWGRLMPAKTRAGVALKEQLEGFKRYLSVAEKDRLTFHDAPEKSPALFSKHLPYAVAFGVETAWAEQFGDILKEAPEWYSATDGSPFSPSEFAHSVQAFSSDFTAASAPASSGASGSGSVGGGFGGGGGGSW